MSIYTGEYYEHTIDGASKGIYYSFTPKSLMDGGFYTADEELFSMMVEAHRALGILEGMVVNMPDGDVLLKPAMLKECHYSRQIDYPDTSLYSLLESCGCGEEMSTVQNIIQAQEKAFTESMNIECLCGIYRIARGNLDSNKQVGLRINPLILRNIITNLLQYSPTAPANIFSALQDMFLYLQQSTSDTLIKAALVHYQFEMIHPFENCNGIIGRMLLSKVMLDGGLRATPYLSLSESLYESKNDYFDLLSSTQKGGGYVRWIKFFISVVYDSAQRRIKQVKRYMQVLKHDEDKIRQSQPARMHNVLTVFEYWKRCLISNIKQPAEELQLSYNAVERAVTILKDLGILKQITETPRYRKYMYSELVDLYLGQQPIWLEQFKLSKKSAAETDRV